MACRARVSIHPLTPTNKPTPPPNTIRQIWRAASALADELIVPLLDRPVVDEQVGPAFNVDLERWRIDGRSTDRRATFAPQQHALTWVQDTKALHRDMTHAERQSGAGFHHARSVRSPRTRPGLNGQPPSTTAGWAHLYRVDAPWAYTGTNIQPLATVPIGSSCAVEGDIEERSTVTANVWADRGGELGSAWTKGRSATAECRPTFLHEDLGVSGVCGRRIP